MDKIRTVPERPDLRVVTHKGEDLQGRDCSTCAVSFLVKRPEILPPGMRPEVFATLKDQRICRLEPPRVVSQAAEGGRLAQSITQGPVMDKHVCWQWRRPGTLPGETNAEAEVRLGPWAPPKLEAAP